MEEMTAAVFVVVVCESVGAVVEAAEDVVVTAEEVVVDVVVAVVADASLLGLRGETTGSRQGGSLVEQHAPILRVH